jgi:hypothetical protein
MLPNICRYTFGIFCTGSGSGKLEFFKKLFLTAVPVYIVFRHRPRCHNFNILETIFKFASRPLMPIPIRFRKMMTIRLGSGSTIQILRVVCVMLQKFHFLGDSSTSDVEMYSRGWNNQLLYFHTGFVTLLCSWF